MSFVFQFDAHCNKLDLVELVLIACGTWMFRERGRVRKRSRTKDGQESKKFLRRERFVKVN